MSTYRVKVFELPQPPEGYNPRRDPAPKAIEKPSAGFAIEGVHQDDAIAKARARLMVYGYEKVRSVSVGVDGSLIATVMARKVAS